MRNFAGPAWRLPIDRHRTRSAIMQTLQAQVGSASRQLGGPGPRMVELVPGVKLPCSVLRFDRNEEVFVEEEDADFVYKVISGAVRDVSILSDGRRQVGAFHLPGDVF